MVSFRLAANTYACFHHVSVQPAAELPIFAFKQNIIPKNCQRDVKKKKKFV